MVRPCDEPLGLPAGERREGRPRTWDVYDLSLGPQGTGRWPRCIANYDTRAAARSEAARLESASGPSTVAGDAAVGREGIA